MTPWFVIVFACKLSLSTCAILPTYGPPYQSREECTLVLKDRIGKLEVNWPLAAGWRIMGYCGLPISGNVPKA